MKQSEMLARRFHETYERLAPSFGYETRIETRDFDPQSQNGKLMISVCAEILSTGIQPCGVDISQSLVNHSRKTNVNRIVCAANRFELNGKFYVIPGIRHGCPVMISQWFLLMEKLGSEGVPETVLESLFAESEQGFLDKHGEFQTRTQAFIIADNACQLVRRVGGDTSNDGTLYSENLY